MSQIVKNEDGCLNPIKTAYSVRTKLASFSEDFTDLVNNVYKKMQFLYTLRFDLKILVLSWLK